MSLMSLVKSWFLKGTETTPVKLTPKALVPEREGQRNMQFIIGGFKGYVYGGPYLKKPEGIIGVKMAKEINAPCEINVPTIDFSVPKKEDLKYGISMGLVYLKQKGEIYAGCMGGIGRTGLYMACLARIMQEIDPDLFTDPIMYVRVTYNHHAVETDEQRTYVMTLDLTDQVLLARALFL